MFHNSLMPGDGVDCFHHSCVGVSEQVGHLGGGKICFFQLGAVGGTPVVVITEALETECLKRFLISTPEGGEGSWGFRIISVDDISACLLQRIKDFYQSFRDDEMTPGKVNHNTKEKSGA